MTRPGVLLTAVVAAAAMSACGATAVQRVAPPPRSEPVRASTPAPATVRTFASPSGNITCVLTARSAACAVSRSSWSLTPAEEHACGASALQGAEVDAGQPARLLCGTGVLVPAPRQTLRYGHRLVVGGFACRSRTSGVTCRGPRHSFAVSRTVLRLS